MARRLLFLAVFLICPLRGSADELAGIQRDLAKIDPHCLPAADREGHRTMMARFVRSGIEKSNADSSTDWNRIQSRADWEQFCRQKLDRLAKSLSRRPFAPGDPDVQVTGELKGEGFRIENLVVRPAGRTVITANLYVPDPPRESMPGILLSHSHHNPKHEGELQDMGMTWARAGCCVLVPDHLGHGERRQHPFHSAADYDREFAVGRQDYYFRYDMSLQLYLVGESLMGWMVHDLMSCVDVLLARQGIDSQRIILLGSVAGGGDPAAVTAALDERIDCVVPFNFGGPQPETRYPLPNDAETRFNYAGSGSWESTRNLSGSAAGGFLPWVIVGSVAPRYLIHAHEFAWDQVRDPVWKRYDTIWQLYGPDVRQRLSFTHGTGTLTGTDPPGSHCNNIGTFHRRQIHEAFRQWFGIHVRPDDEYRNRRTRDQLACLTQTARQKLQPPALHEVLARLADQQLAAARTGRDNATLADRRNLMRESWTRLLGNTDPPRECKVVEGSPHVQRLETIMITREILETEPGIAVPIMTLATNQAPASKTSRTAVTLVVATDGIAKILERRGDLIAETLNKTNKTAVVVLAEVRGTGASSPGSDRGQQGSATAYSATQLMLGPPMITGQLRDLRAVWQHIGRGMLDRKIDDATVFGDSGFSPLAGDTPFAHPRRIDGRPRECEPTGALLSALLALFEEDLDRVVCRGGLVSFRSALDSPFVQIPHESIVPGLLCEGDFSDLIAALAPRQVELDSLVDARGRRVSSAAGR